MIQDDIKSQAPRVNIDIQVNIREEAPGQKPCWKRVLAAFHLLALVIVCVIFLYYLFTWNIKGMFFSALASVPLIGLLMCYHAPYPMYNCWD